MYVIEKNTDDIRPSPYVTIEAFQYIGGGCFPMIHLFQVIELQGIL